jgi:hypothetical protein
LDFNPHRGDPGITGKSGLRLSWIDRLVWVGPYALALIIMLPRLASPQFGLLDDGNSLRVAQLLAGGHWQLGDVAVGRSRPLYWLLWSLPYLIAGPSPFWYFFTNLITLLVLVMCVIKLCGMLKMGRLASWLAVVIFLLVGPGAENFSTLSKGEPLQLILVLLALILGLAYHASRIPVRTVTTWLLIPMLTFLAGITKETVLVMIPISLAWFALASLATPTGAGIDRKAVRAALFGFTLGGACFLVYRVATVGTEFLGSGYGSGFEFSVARVLDTGSRWLAWLLRDFSFLLPLAVMPFVWRRTHASSSRIDILLGALIWMAGWLVIFLPWLFVAEYYLLPFSLGAALFASVLVGDAVTIIKQRGSTRVATSVLLSLAGVLFCANVINFSTVARLQLAVDGANAAVVRFLASEVPQGGTVLVNIQEPTEYVSQIGLHLVELYDRPDIQVVPLQVATLSGAALSGNVLIASPYIQNQVLLSGRLGVYEPKLQVWNGSVAGFVRAHAESAYHDRREVRGLSFDPARSACPLFAANQSGLSAAGLPVVSITRYCQGGALIDRRVFSYGWDVYRLNRP